MSHEFGHIEFFFKLTPEEFTNHKKTFAGDGGHSDGNRSGENANLRQEQYEANKK